MMATSYDVIVDGDITVDTPPSTVPCAYVVRGLSGPGECEHCYDV